MRGLVLDYDDLIIMMISTKQEDKFDKSIDFNDWIWMGDYYFVVVVVFW